MFKLAVLIKSLLLASLIFSGTAAAEMQIFELHHRSASELAQMVRSLVDESAKVAVHRNTMVVNASPEELVDIRKLVASYDRAQHMLRVTVEQGSILDERDRELSASGRIHSGSTTIGVKGSEWGDGGAIYITSGGDQLKIQGQDLSRRENRNVSQFMTVMEGSPARISVGKAIPFTSQMRTYWRRHPAYVESIEYVNVDTGFEVLPVIVGEAVQLEIRPFMAFLNTQSPEQIVFHELSTKVQVPFGAWYDLGGQMSTQDGLSREILGAGSRTSGSNNSIRVRVDPEH